MSKPLTLLMAIHCHQPVGNFRFVFEEAYNKSYNPFLHVLERHPGIRLALHYSGPLLDWLVEEHPEFLDRVRALVSRGQVELLASGYYEPILPLIPEADRQGQIAQMRRTLRERFGAESSGLWLTERVWEPDLPASLSRAGLRYTMVDANQFASAKPWLPAALQIQDEAFWDLFGSYSTEYAGSTTLLFPASRRLRYWMPFQPIERTLEFLKGIRREVPLALTFADDGEKFGLWPKTYHWVYEEGWLDRFFTALERESDWLGTMTFQDYVEETIPDGRVYLPCGSYEEMLEWSGGYFRNFFAKYPEANAMQQKMLRVSRTIAELKTASLQASGSRLHKTDDKKGAAYSLQPATRKREALLQRAENELYAGQCNCAYWHGVFGGLYLSHLRRAVYAHLLAAEEQINRIADGAKGLRTVDGDGDGCEEISLKTDQMSLLVDPDEGAVLTEWSLYPSGVNLLDVLTRRPEPYHGKLKQKLLQAVGAEASAAESIHDVLGVKEDNLAEYLVYDERRRSAFLDHPLQRMPTLQEIVRSSWAEQQLWSPGAFRWERKPPRKGRGEPLALSMVRVFPDGRITKTLQLSADRLELECGYRLEGLRIPVVGLEFNLSLRDERYLKGAERLESVSRFTIEEPSLGVSLRLSVDPPATLVHYPIETVSESEEGLERTYQGLCVVCLWTLNPPADAKRRETGPVSWESRLLWTVEPCPARSGQ